jgi:hypothetical protein
MEWVVSGFIWRVQRNSGPTAGWMIGLAKATAGRAVGGHAGVHDFESRPIFRAVEKFFSRGRRGHTA